MSISSVAATSSLAIQQLVNMRKQLNELQRQFSTGERSDTYAGIGVERGTAVSLRAQLAAIGSYNDTISLVSTRLSLAQTALGRMGNIGSTMKSAMVQAGYGADGSGAQTAQKTALTSLDELVGLLNTQVGGRYLFSGRTTDKPAVESLDRILNGYGARAGLKQLIAERKAADLGASGLGRLTVTTPTATSVALTEDAVSPFGFKLASVSASLSNGTVTGPAGSPASLSVDFTAPPNTGDTITLRFTLPDGSSESLTLTATTTTPPGAGEFTIGATAAATASNLQTALTTALGKLAGGALTAASAVAASSEFFAADINNPPLRVAGPPFDSATALVAGSATDSVIWYMGEAGSDPARGTATARIDQSLVIAYGARANEDGIRTVVQNVATLAVVNVTPADPNAADLSAALNARLTSAIGGSAGGQSVQDIAIELGASQVAVEAAKTRHQQTASTLGEFLQNITGVSNEELGAQILALQTRMQASMQTTAILFQTSLVNYLG